LYTNEIACQAGAPEDHEVVGALANPLVDHADKQTRDVIQLIRADRLYGLSFAMIERTVHEHLEIIHELWINARGIARGSEHIRRETRTLSPQ
jgi:hypothetical protein